jgi:hypothetical protein
VEAFGIETTNFAAVGDEVQAVAFHEWRAANTLQRPVVHAARRQLLAAVLPHEFAVLDIETKQNAKIVIGREAFQPASAVVRADVGLTAGDDDVAIRLRAEPRNPLDILALFRLPRAGLVIELADVPLGRNVMTLRCVVPHRRATPL